ncbi:MAG: serine/threonine protein kinase [Myxococcales bacterium]|nr:serine/threonine protein kinase [Myxococcales bacterium]
MIRRIGAGGMAETLECLRTSPGGITTRVCVKRMLPGHRDDPELVRLFEREARLSLQLSHGGIARAIETLVDDEGPALVLEYVEGIDLRAYLTAIRERGELPPIETVLLILKDLLLALHHAHTLETDAIPNGLVHRDISPSNVLLGIDGDVKLVDFGIAKAVGDSYRTATGIIRGKIPYMAPEYARTGHYDVRSDLFSLGVVAYELLTLTRPYQGRNDPETLEHAALGRRAPLASFRAHVPPALEAVVESLLSPRPDDRPRDAREVLESLAGLGGEVSARTALAAEVRARREARAKERMSLETAATSPAAIEPTRAIVEGETAPLSATEPLPVAEATLLLTNAAADGKRSAPELGASRSTLVGVVAVGVALAVLTWLALSSG